MDSMSTHVTHDSLGICIKFPGKCSKITCDHMYSSTSEICLHKKYVKNTKWWVVARVICVVARALLGDTWLFIRRSLAILYYLKFLSLDNGLR